ncbi:sigma-70 family RNA polymerase sigma factor [Actinophytocola sp.]|uniref:sigma-70 family RNA polymerase sigma factor n=1 Tax=Actinophytocola sp. TaxID=1872138 RepID=UPI002D803617|nr:sigma-70 family RNA polymerase sigma factor [Actinophytocola sp.]HET9140338.1 sigma-70 family RNA polymerase sigma factor [Actinophytocola sp.]
MALDTRIERTRDSAGRSDETDLVRHYLREIGGTPLLTAAQEVALAKRIEAGVYAAELLRRAAAEGIEPPATRRQELAEAARDGQAAKDHMIRANLRLVVAAARKYQRRGVALLDVIQEGNLGLIRAVEKFDYVKGFKFSTYAMWWIRQAIERGLAEQSRTVRLPVHVVEQVNKITRVERTLADRLGRAPVAAELAAECDLPEERVTELRRAARNTVSLDTPLGDDGEMLFGDLVEDSAAVQPEELAERRALTTQLRTLVGTLAPREALIMSLRYGLTDGREHTLAEIAQRLGLTKEWIRQLEKESLVTLRDPGRSRPLLDWAS